MEILQKTGTGSDDSRPCFRLGFFRMMSLARLGLPGLCRSLLRGLCLLVGEHLLLDEHTVGLRGVLLADDGDGSEFLEVPPAHVSFRPGPEFSELPAIGCLTSVSAYFVCSHGSSPGLSGPPAVASWSMAGSGIGTFDWMLGNSRSSRFGTGVSSESMPSR